MAGDRQHYLRNLALFALLGSITTGCTALQPKPWSLLGANPASETVPPTPTIPQETFVVELQPANGKLKTASVPLTQDLHVQEALEKVNGFKRFSRFDVELHRQMPQGGLHRMTIDYARATRRVEPEFDYVLHPGDRLIVRESTETMLDDALGAVLEPLGLERFKQSSQPKQTMPARYRMEG